MNQPSLKTQIIGQRTDILRRPVMLAQRTAIEDALTKTTAAIKTALDENLRSTPPGIISDVTLKLEWTEDTEEPVISVILSRLVLQNPDKIVAAKASDIPPHRQ